MNTIKQAKLALLLGCYCAALPGQAQQTSFQPDTAKLDNKADRSQDLYVDPAFNFITYQTLTLDLKALDDQGLPLANQMIFVFGSKSSLPATSESPANGPSDKGSLLGILLTDEAGSVFREMEVGADIQRISLSLQSVGVEGQHAFVLSEGTWISHQFE